jgi:hypothetical protein
MSKIQTIHLSWNHSRHPPGLHHPEHYWTDCLDTSSSLWKSQDVPAYHVQEPDASLRGHRQNDNGDPAGTVQHAGKGHGGGGNLVPTGTQREYIPVRIIVSDEMGRTPQIDSSMQAALASGTYILEVHV